MTPTVREVESVFILTLQMRKLRQGDQSICKMTESEFTPSWVVPEFTNTVENVDT